MKTWIALLRGINVGGNNILPMADLRTILESLGYQNVKTYIQSGNCVFLCDETSAATINESIEEAVEAQFGFRPRCVTLSQKQLATALSKNPFAEQCSDPKHLHFYFLEKNTRKKKWDELEALRKDNEQVHVDSGVVYLYAPDGVWKSKLAASIEKVMGIQATARNLRTVEKLNELVDSIQDGA